ncbi:hypothetical protein CU098_011321, partial [Rhizopus stolonifer]
MEQLTWNPLHYPETPLGSPNLNHIKNESDIVDENNDDTDGSRISYLDTAKYIFTKHDPNHNELYDCDFLTNQIYKIINHSGVLTQKKISENKVPVRGRSLYVLKKSIQENFTVNKRCFKKYVQNSDGEWINIGHAREMISKVINNGFCEKIYVSPCSSAQDSIFKRDFKIEHKYGDGNTQDFLRYLSIYSKKIRVCIISYAGLTTNIEDLQKFI